MKTMKIENITDRGDACFVAIEDGQQMGRTEYHLSPEGKVVITYVGISPEYRGVGNGDKFIKGIVDYCRTNDLKVVPVCPFSRSVFERHPELRDVL